MALCLACSVGPIKNVDPLLKENKCTHTDTPLLSLIIMYIGFRCIGNAYQLFVIPCILILRHANATEKLFLWMPYYRDRLALVLAKDMS